MKLGVSIIAYNEAENIKACIRNWEGVADRIVVLVSVTPWNGSPVGEDNTYLLAKQTSAEVVLGCWKTEHEQRTYGLAMMRDCDFVLQVDPDEFYTKSDQQIIKNKLSNPIDVSYRPDVPPAAFRTERIVTFWKDFHHVLSPEDNHKPVIAVDPKQAYGYEHRNFALMTEPRGSIPFMPLIPVTTYHLSWVKSDAKVKEKIQSYSHHDAISNDWYDNVWKRWEHGSDLQVRPYGEEASIVVDGELPEEIRSLFN